MSQLILEIIEKNRYKNHNRHHNNNNISKFLFILIMVHL